MKRVLVLKLMLLYLLVALFAAGFVSALMLEYSHGQTYEQYENYVSNDCGFNCSQNGINHITEYNEGVRLRNENAIERWIDDTHQQERERDQDARIRQLEKMLND